MLTTALIYENLLRYQVQPSELKTLRIAQSGGMHVCATLAEDFKKRFNIPITSGWGSTETTGIALSMSTYFDYRTDSIGKPCPYYEVKIVDEAGIEVRANEIGEMLIKGHAVCSEYFHNPEETAKHMRNGWLHTDDLVKKDKDGYFYFVSRKSRMIKAAGLRVYPEEIENVLMTHPNVVEVAVVKIPDSALGDAPKAIVVLKNNAVIKPEDLRKYCAERMAKYKVPVVIEAVARLPRSPSGKILYHKL
jgi:long-chain acyl-CoA synthetase